MDNIKKPKKLYIGTQTKGIKELIPNKGRYRDKNEGAVIFATPDKALASIFLVDGHNDNWMKIGYFGKSVHVVIQMDKEEFLEKDKGGVMYEVPGESFSFSSNLGMGIKEWTSLEPVNPLREIFYLSVFNAMIENGVNVYFIDSKTFNDIRRSKDHGFEIINSLVPEKL